MPGENAKRVRRFVDEALNAGNYSALEELVHEDYVYRSPGEALTGAEVLQQLLETFRSGLPDMHTAIDDLVASGDRVAISVTLSGTHSGELMGIPATGRRLSVHGMIFSRLEDGRIVEEWEILDMLGLYQQLGVSTLPSSH